MILKYQPYVSIHVSIPNKLANYFIVIDVISTYKFPIEFDIYILYTYIHIMSNIWIWRQKKTTHIWYNRLLSEKILYRLIIIFFSLIDFFLLSLKIVALSFNFDLILCDHTEYLATVDFEHHHRHNQQQQNKNKFFFWLFGFANTKWFLHSNLLSFVCVVDDIHQTIRIALIYVTLM